MSGAPDAPAIWSSLVSNAKASGKTGDMTGVILLLRERRQQKGLPAEHVRQLGVIVHNMAILAKSRGDMRGAIEGYEEAASIYREAGDKALEQGAIGEHVDGLMAVGDYQRALPLAAERARICRELGDQAAIFNATAVQGKLLQWAGDTEHAAEVAEMQEELAQDLGDDSLAVALSNRGLGMIVENRLDEAHELLERAEGLLRKGTNRRVLANTIGSRAVVLMQKGDREASLSLQKEAADICRETGDGEGLAKALTMQGLLLSEMGQPDVAYPLVVEADRLARSLGQSAMAEEMIKPILAMCSPPEPAFASPPRPQPARAKTDQGDYQRRLDAWSALPWLKRIRTPRPQPPGS